MCDACGLVARKPSKSLLEMNINFSTPLLRQNHVSLNVGSVHWLTPKSQATAKQLCDGEVSSTKCVHTGKPSHGSQPPPSPLQPNVVEEKNVQVGSKGINRKGLTFEKHGNFLELNETHSGEEGDPQGPVLMDELGNASVEEVANNSTKEQLVSNAPSFGIKEPETSK